jgi:PAS domain S-box-containing protein
MQTPAKVFSKNRPQRWMRTGSFLISLAALALLATTFNARFYSGSLSPVLLTLVLIALCIAIALHIRSLIMKGREQVETSNALDATERGFQQMADNIQEIFWMLDAESLKVLYVNQAYETITGRSCQSLIDDPNSYEEVIHPEDRVRVLYRWNQSVEIGEFDEEFRITKPDKAVRWVLVRGFPVKDSTGIVRRLVGTAQDISARKSAEEQMARNLDLAESAWAEAEAFRKTSLALTQNLSMDYVLDTLLESLLNLIPCESAQIFLIEADDRLFLAREVQHRKSSRWIPQAPGILNGRDNRFLRHVLTGKGSLLIRDTGEEIEWRRFTGFSHLRSWLCVPLVTSERVLGFLSLGDTDAQALSDEHLRLAKSLAIPAAVAIQNARLYERAEIYGVELEQRLADLEVARQALRLAEEGRTLSEERFTKVFRSSPIPFSITTLEEGRFVDVNDAFVRQYGFSRQQVIGRTGTEIGVWDYLSERAQVINDIHEHRHVRNRVTRLRTKSGQVVDTVISAEAVDLEGHKYLLAVFDDLLNLANPQVPLSLKSDAAL